MRTFILVLCLILGANAWGQKTLMDKMGIPRREVPEVAPQIRGTLKIVLLDSRNICVSGDYQEFIQDRYLKECGKFLRKMETDEFRPQDWSRRFHYKYAAQEVQRAYRPQIVAAWERGFEVRENGKPVSVRRYGYWPNPVSAGHYPVFGPEREMVNEAAQVTDHLFLELEKPMTEGAEYTLTNTLGESVRFRYTGKNRSLAIQVNQVGTAADAGRKYAYLGVWRGPELGGADYSDWEGKPFYLVNARGKRVFEGVVQKRETTDPARDRFTGCAVWDLDFSAFTEPGHYAIEVPGVGRSWDFVLGNDALGEAFYVRMRGMYQKRCGCEKAEPFTHWTGGACHRTTYRGNFAPNWRHYGLGKGDEGFYDAHGNRVEVRQFDLIHRACTTDEVVPGLSGGWHDAGDYDRRSLHLKSVGDFTTAYLLCPENFSDGQLNLPESGNGVPDILDEAVWGAEVWRRAQNPQGGVGCWIEADSHPGNFVPETDEQPYFLAFPTMESSAEYASYAAGLALALHRAGDESRSRKFADSAKLAYQYAQDSKNRAIVQFSEIPVKQDGKTVTLDVTYRESAQLSGDSLGKTALCLYLLTQDKKYLDDFNRFRPLGFDRALNELSWNTSPFWCAELILCRDMPELKEVFDIYSAEIIKLADVRLSELNDNYPIRMPWYAPTHAYVSHMSWGNFHPLNRGKVFITAWKLSGDSKYRDAALLCNDWQLGANPTGSSMTSGLGRNYPVRFLDLPSYADGVEEFVPGISPYRYTFGLNRGAVTFAYGLYLQERTDHGFPAVQIPLVPMKGREIPDVNEFARFVAEQIPILHRFGNVEGWSVAASEYTVWETIAPGAAVTGCLLTPGWKPGSELKERRPASNLRDLPGYWALP